ncbi:uncharacterized protein LOC115989139 [Quercus lobata]|nr:uncharacterized protein LOC115989139 [Quercus lobata]
MLPEWIVHRFTSVIRERHFSTFRTNFQIPDYIPIRLPYVSERCYYDGVEGVGVYEQVLKAGLRFPLSTLHRELLHYLGLSVTQISPNAWRVFIAMEILYGAMSNGERRLTVREFLHCYRPDEIDRSRGLYRFASRSPLLKVIFETPDSNRDWKSRYFFLEGDRWMNRPGETEYMPVDTTWGIINQARRGRPQVSLEEFSFLEKVCRKAKPDERTWAKLVNPKTIHWYCDGPEPTREAIAYDERIHKQMDDAKRRAMIKSLAVEQKKTGEIVVPSVPGSSGKRKQPPKSDRPHKQPKVSMEPIVGLMAEGPKAVNQVKQGAGKGLMHAPPVSEEKPPPLLRDDSKFALEKLTSILSAEDYEDLGNHSTEAMGETGLFAVGQSLVMMKGLMDRCLNREAALERVRSKLGKTEEELSQLHKWKSTMEQKFELSENTRKELEQKTEEAGKVLKSRADEVKDLKKKLRHAKDDAVSEYRNSESLLKELGGSFLQGFDDALRQIKKTYPDLDVSMITLTDQDQTSALPVASENTEDLFGEEAAQGDGESAPPNEVAVADPKKAE